MYGGKDLRIGVDGRQFDVTVSTNRIKVVEKIGGSVFVAEGHALTHIFRALQVVRRVEMLSR